MDVSALKSKYAGPALVIGGGKSALRTLLAVPFIPSFTLSANEHGFKQRAFSVDFIVTGAQLHYSGARMVDLLGSFGPPIIGRHDWADYLLDWDLPCNSGLTAVAVAQFLGANRVVAVGLDLGGGYFHDPARPDIECRDDYTQQMAALKAHMTVPFEVLR